MPSVPPLRVGPGARHSAGAGVRLPVLLLILGILVSGLAVWAPAADQRASSERSYTLTRGAQEMLTAMLDQETGLRGYVLTADDQAARDSAEHDSIPDLDLASLWH